METGMTIDWYSIYTFVLYFVVSLVISIFVLHPFLCPKVGIVVTMVVYMAVCTILHNLIRGRK